MFKELCRDPRRFRCPSIETTYRYLTIMYLIPKLAMFVILDTYWSEILTYPRCGVVPWSFTHESEWHWAYGCIQLGSNPQIGMHTRMAVLDIERVCVLQRYSGKIISTRKSELRVGHLNQPGSQTLLNPPIAQGLLAAWIFGYLWPASSTGSLFEYEKVTRPQPSSVR